MVRAGLRCSRRALLSRTDFLDNYSRLRRSEAIIIADSFRNYKFLGDLPRHGTQRKAVERRGLGTRREMLTREKERERRRGR